MMEKAKEILPLYLINIYIKVRANTVKLKYSVIFPSLHHFHLSIRLLAVIKELLYSDVKSIRNLIFNCCSNSQAKHC